MTKLPGPLPPRDPKAPDGGGPRSRLQSTSDAATPASRAGSGEPTVGADLQVILRVVCEAGSNILEPTHHYATTLAKSRFRPTIAEKVSLACWELFSNALSYGSISRPVVLELRDTKAAIEISVSNEAIGARLQILEQRVQQLKVDAKGTYLEEMRRSLTGGTPRATLGLARITHEAKMELGIEIVNLNRVTVTARCRL